MLDLDRLLRVAVDQRASDVHLKVGARPHLRVDGALVETPLDLLEPADTAAAAKALLGEAAAPLAKGREVDSVHAVAGLGRFRVGAFLQRGRIGLVLRRVVPGVPSIEALGLPPIATTLAGHPSGFVLVTGLAGSGRTSTLAALVDAVNATRRCHILTIESPVEVVHDDKLAVVDQREVGTDTPSALAALRSAAHQDPDVLAVGDLDDAGTALAALERADAGHLVLGVTQAVSAPDAVTRLIDRFAADERAAVHALLARSLRGVLCQRLVPRAGGRGRVPAVEVLTVNALVADRSPTARRAIG